MRLSIWNVKRVQPQIHRFKYFNKRLGIDVVFYFLETKTKTNIGNKSVGLLPLRITKDNKN